MMDIVLNARWCDLTRGSRSRSLLIRYSMIELEIAQQEINQSKEAKKEQRIIDDLFPPEIELSDREYWGMIATLLLSLC